jgi:hypothetical protein
MPLGHSAARKDDKTHPLKEAIVEWNGMLYKAAQGQDRVWRDSKNRVLPKARVFASLQQSWDE